MTPLIFGTPEALALAQRNRTVDQAMEWLNRYDRYDEEIDDLKLDIQDVYDDARNDDGRRLTHEERQRINEIKDEIRAAQIGQQRCEIGMSEIGWSLQDARDHHISLSVRGALSVVVG
jgi:hypothetical protein